MNNENPRRLTLKQRRWIKAYIKTGSATKAAQQVYDVSSYDSAAQIGSENLKKLQYSDLMESMGLTDVALLNIGAEGMTKPVKQSITGEVHPDYGVRHKYWDTMLKLKGRLKEKAEANVDIGEVKILVVPPELIGKYGISQHTEPSGPEQGEIQGS